MVLTWIPEGWVGGGGGGLNQFWKSRWNGVGAKICLLSGGGVDFFWNNPMRVIFDSNRTDKLNWPSK